MGAALALCVAERTGAGVAGPLKLARNGAAADGRAVAVLTGNGLKDPETALATYKADVTKASATVEGVERALGL